MKDKKLLYFAFRSDEEVYGWMDDINSRSPLMGVSQPINFVHQVHVGFDPVSGGFIVSSEHSLVLTLQGLPPQWTKLLTSSAITQEDAARDPEAVVDVLQFYINQQLGQSSQQFYGAGPAYPQDSSAAKGRFNGLGLGGQATAGSTPAPLSSSASPSQRDGSSHPHASTARSPDVAREDVSTAPHALETLTVRR